MQLFDKQVQIRMGQANVRAWTKDLMPFLEQDGDPLGVETFATHHLPLDERRRPTGPSRPSPTAWSRSSSTREPVPARAGEVTVIGTSARCASPTTPCS